MRRQETTSREQQHAWMRDEHSVGHEREADRRCWLAGLCLSQPTHLLGLDPSLADTINGHRRTIPQHIYGRDEHNRRRVRAARCTRPPSDCLPVSLRLPVCPCPALLCSVPPSPSLLTSLFSALSGAGAAAASDMVAAGGWGKWRDRDGSVSGGGEGRGSSGVCSKSNDKQIKGQKNNTSTRIRRRGRPATAADTHG